MFVDASRSSTSSSHLSLLPLSAQSRTPVQCSPRSKLHTNTRARKEKREKRERGRDERKRAGCDGKSLQTRDDGREGDELCFYVLRKTEIIGRERRVWVRRRNRNVRKGEQVKESRTKRTIERASNKKAREREV